MSKKKYRLGYDYLFLASPPFEYKGEIIGSISINVIFKVCGKGGEEFTYKEDKDHRIYLTVNKDVYAYQLFNCRIDWNNLFVLEPRLDLQRPLGKVTYSVVGYTKEVQDSIDSCMMESVEISKGEFEEILRCNFEKFDNSDNKSAQNTSYFTQEITPKDHRHEKN